VTFARRLALATGVGVAVRVAWLVAVASVTTGGSTDQTGYVHVAEAWASGRFGTGMLRSPGYPALLALATKLTGGPDGVVPLRVGAGVAQIALAALTIVTVGVLTRRLTGSDGAGLVAATVLAIWPNQVAGSAVLMSESLSTPALFGAAAIALWRVGARPVTAPGRRRAAVAAAVAGVALLTRPALAPSVIVIVALVGWGPGPARERLTRLAVPVAALLLVLAPWLVVSSIKEGSPSLDLASAGGFNVCLGNGPGATGRWDTAAAAGRCRLRANGRGELADGRRLARDGLRWAWSHPGEQPRLVGSRLAHTFATDDYWFDWYPAWDDYRGPWASDGHVARWLVIVNRVWWTTSAAAALAGLIGGLVARRRPTMWAAAIAGGAVLAPLATIGDPRFHDALVPFVAVGVGAAVAAARRRPREPQEGEPIPAR